MRSQGADQQWTNLLQVGERSDYGFLTELVGFHVQVQLNVRIIKLVNDPM